MVGSAAESEPAPEWTPELDAADLRDLQEAEQDPSRIISRLPREAARLGYFSTICLIFNRMIGACCFAPIMIQSLSGCRRH
jgi:hypothetical protein